MRFHSDRIRLGPLSSNNLEQVIYTHYTHGAQANSAFHPSVVGKSSTGLSGWG